MMVQAIKDNEDFNFESAKHLLGCMAHVINLAARDGLAVFGTIASPEEASDDPVFNPLNISNLVDRPDGAEVNLKTVVACIHGLTTDVRGSTQRHENFQSCITLSQQLSTDPSSANQPSKSLILDIKTWWNSTYQMLECALELQEECDLYFA